MLRKAVLLINDILNDNKISSRNLYLCLEKGIDTLELLKDIYDKDDSKQIEEISESIESFMLILELANFYSTEEKNS